MGAGVNERGRPAGCASGGGRTGAGGLGTWRAGLGRAYLLLQRSPASLSPEDCSANAEGV
jgi:hypothetical protein